MIDANTPRSEMIAYVGHQAFGEDWVKVFAHSLPTFHPDGPRGPLLTSLVEKWAADEMPVPDWVIRAMPSMLTALVEDMRKQASRIESLAVSLLDLEKELLATTKAGRPMYDA
jgi:hypothetical protein